MNQARDKSKSLQQPSFEEQVFVTLLRTADALSRGGEELLKAHDLSPTQYNVLRILRGAGENGLACREVGERLISRDPDITRLFDRLESRGLIARAREATDRRVVKTRITKEGLDLLRQLDGPIQEFHRRQLGRMSQRQLRQLYHLLERARELAVETQPSDSDSQAPRLFVNQLDKRRKENGHRSHSNTASQQARRVAD